MNYWTAFEKFGTPSDERRNGLQFILNAQRWTVERLTIYSERIAMNGGTAYEKNYCERVATNGWTANEDFEPTAVNEPTGKPKVLNR